MAKDVILAADLGGDILTADQLAAIPDFSGIRKEIWDKFPGAIARKEYRAGEILMREGENGTTAFYILSGSIELFLNTPFRTLKATAAAAGDGSKGSPRSPTTLRERRRRGAVADRHEVTFRLMRRWIFPWKTRLRKCMTAI